jgi:hypothetical protein
MSTTHLCLLYAFFPSLRPLAKPPHGTSWFAALTASSSFLFSRLLQLPAEVRAEACGVQR